MKMNFPWTFQKVQYGYWGQTPLKDKNGKPKLVTVRAASLEDAQAIVMKRKDYYQRLRNGDSRTWIFVGETL